MQLKTMIIVITIATLFQLANAITILTANSFHLALPRRLLERRRAGEMFKIMRGPLAGRFAKRH